MIDPCQLPLRRQIDRLEAARGRRVLVLAALSLDLDLLTPLDHACRQLGGPVDALDVVLLARGGCVNATRRVALLLRRFAKRLTLHVPHYCESSGTLLAMAADEIVAGDMAIFTPIDPHLDGAAGADAATSALSCRDIEEFVPMAREWFEVASPESRVHLLSILCGNMEPAAVTALYRATREVERIGEELLRFHLPGDPARRRQIVHQLVHGYGSHNYALTASEMLELGLSVRRDADAETVAWEIARALHDVIGGGLRQAPDDPFCDAVLATRDEASVRERGPGGLNPRWKEAQVVS